MSTKNRNIGIIAYKRFLQIPWIGRKTNVPIIQELNVQAKDRFLVTIQNQILKFLGYVIKIDGLEKIIIQEKVKGKRNEGRPHIRYTDQIKTLAQLSVAKSIRNREN